MKILGPPNQNNMLVLLFSVVLMIAQSVISVGHYFGASQAPPSSSRRLFFLVEPNTIRGGYQGAEEEETLDEKVRKAMLKLGLAPPDEQGGVDVESSPDQNCQDGVCELPGMASTEEIAADSTSTAASDNDAEAIADKLAAEFQIDENLAIAAVLATSTLDSSSGNRTFGEDAARQMIQLEIDRIAQVSENHPDVQTLVSEGFRVFFSRRALAFADGNLDDARAILLADQLDEEEEYQQQDRQQSSIETSEPRPPQDFKTAADQLDEEEEHQLQDTQQSSVETSESRPPQGFKTVTGDANVDATDANIDPTHVAPPAQSTTTTPAPQDMPTPAKRHEVVFEATAAQIQELVLESPVPVLLDVYADWCGPCKVLGPALEEMAIKSGGAFRLVKVNSDNERAISTTLQVTALPTVFGVRNGQIVNMFQGMPRSDDAIKSFMMGLLVGDVHFNPRVTESQKKLFQELTLKVVKMASAACFSFSARERLQERVASQLEELVAHQAKDFVDAEDATRVLRSLMSNIIRDPHEPKYRKVNLANKVVAAQVAKYPACLAILKNVGFVPSGDNELTMGKDRKIVNVAPLLVARDCIDKWVDKSRSEVAAAARKRKDEEDRARLQLEANDMDQEEDDEEVKETFDPDAAMIKLRIDGKKKVYDIALHADDPLSSVLDRLPVAGVAEEEVQITCVAKRLKVKSSDSATMKKSLRELGLTPKASLVVNLGEAVGADEASGGLAERAASQKKKKKGSHTMQSIGIYAKDDNAKAELIDGGGGTWYEHDVTDDEEESKEGDDAAPEEPEKSVEEDSD